MTEPIPKHCLLDIDEMISYHISLINMKTKKFMILS